MESGSSGVESERSGGGVRKQWGWSQEEVGVESGSGGGVRRKWGWSQEAVGWSQVEVGVELACLLLIPRVSHNDIIGGLQIRRQLPVPAHPALPRDYPRYQRAPPDPAHPARGEKGEGGCVVMSS